MPTTSCDFIFQVRVPPEMVHINSHTYPGRVKLFCHIICLADCSNCGAAVSIHRVQGLNGQFHPVSLCMGKNGCDTVTYLFTRFGKGLTRYSTANQYNQGCSRAAASSTAFRLSSIANCLSRAPGCVKNPPRHRETMVNWWSRSIWPVFLYPCLPKYLAKR